MLILIAHIYIHRIGLLRQICFRLHLDLDISGSVLTDGIHENRTGSGRGKKCGVCSVLILSLHCSHDLKDHIVDAGRCGSILQMQRQHKALPCMYVFGLRLKAGDDNSRNRSFSVCPHTGSPAELYIGIQRRLLTVALRIPIDDFKGDLLITVAHVASGLQIPGHLPAAVHIGHAGIGPWQILDGLGIVGAGDLKGPGSGVRTQDGRHDRVSHHGLAHVHHGKDNADRLPCIGHGRDPVAAHHQKVVSADGGGVVVFVVIIIVWWIHHIIHFLFCSRNISFNPFGSRHIFNLIHGF